MKQNKGNNKKTLPARRSRVTHMKFLRKLLQEKAMAETMWENKVTNIPITNQYHLVVVFNTQPVYIIISNMFLAVAGSGIGDLFGFEMVSRVLNAAYR